MKICKGNEPLSQNSSSLKTNFAFSIKEQQILIAFFSTLLEIEIDQQNNVVKEYVDAEQVK